MLPLSDEPTELTPEERRREIAALLARGGLRLFQAPSPAPEPGAPKSAAGASEPLHKELEISEASSVHVTSGSRN